MKTNVSILKKYVIFRILYAYSYILWFFCEIFNQCVVFEQYVVRFSGCSLFSYVALSSGNKHRSAPLVLRYSRRKTICFARLQHLHRTHWVDKQYTQYLCMRYGKKQTRAIKTPTFHIEEWYCAAILCMIRVFLNKFECDK